MQFRYKKLKSSNFVKKKILFVYMLHIIVSVYLLYGSSHNLHFCMLNKKLVIENFMYF